MPKHPNILLIMADQMRHDAMEMVNPSIRTPNLRRIAQAGSLFSRAYAPTPVCLPCRASVVTGQYPSTHGATHNHSHLPEDYGPTIASILGRGGYYTHMVGKSHFSNCHDPASPESAPHIHNRAYFRSWHGPWYGFQRADLSIGHTTEKHACGMHYGAWLEDRGVDTSKYFGHTAYEQYGAWDLPEQFHSSTWIADTAIETFSHAQCREQPFFLWANFQDPHNPCMVPEPWAVMYDPEKLPRFGMKPGEPDSFAQKPPFYQEVLEQKGDYACKPGDVDLRGAGNLSSLQWSQRQIQENAAHYYGMVSLMDKHIGRMLDALEGNGQLENTLIVFTSDHGDLLGDHGMHWKSMACFEESIRLPFLASFPGKIPSGATNPCFQSLVDLAPTFAGLAGLSVPHQFEGVDQMPTWTGAVKPARVDVVVEERPYSTSWNQRILIDENHKLCFYAGREYGELYNMESDPNHINNLWEAATHRDVRERMIGRLLSREMNRANARPSHTGMHMERFDPVST